MEALLIQKTIEKDGELRMTDLPCPKGQSVQIIILYEPKKSKKRKYMTAGDLLASDLVGIWQDRTDIDDTLEFAQKLRKQAETRRHK